MEREDKGRCMNEGIMGKKEHLFSTTGPFLFQILEDLLLLFAIQLLSLYFNIITLLFTGFANQFGMVARIKIGLHLCLF